MKFVTEYKDSNAPTMRALTIHRVGFFVQRLHPCGLFNWRRYVWWLSTETTRFQLRVLWFGFAIRRSSKLMLLVRGEYTVVTRADVEWASVFELAPPRLLPEPMRTIRLLCQAGF